MRALGFIGATLALFGAGRGAPLLLIGGALLWIGAVVCMSFDPKEWE